MSETWEDPRIVERGRGYVLNPEQVKGIRYLYATHKETQVQIAARYGVSERTIRLALSNDNYVTQPKHIMAPRQHQQYSIPSSSPHNHGTRIVRAAVYDFTGSDTDLRGWAVRVTQQRHNESVARALAGGR